MAAKEIAALLDVTTSHLHQIMKTDPTCPPPHAVLSVGRIWLATDVEKWAQERKARMEREKAR
jgi:hypothetical protein